MNSPSSRDWVPLELEPDPRERKRREDHAMKVARQQRVEKRGLEPCPVCGGAVDEDVDEESLVCVCRRWNQERWARKVQRDHEKRTDLTEDNVSDRIVP